MASPKGRLLTLLGGLLLSEATLSALRPLGPELLLMTLKVDPTLDFQAGDKIQIVLPDQDVRTYTPLYWTPEGESALLVYLHGAGTPGTTWARQAKVGDTLRFIGPQRSLRMAPGPLTLVGDETSIAVAAALTRARPGAVRVVLEVAADLVLGDTLAALGLGDATLLRRSAEAPTAMVDAITAGEAGAIGLTGGSELIQRVRAGLKARGIKPAKLKTYWIPGRAGLD